jgi:hypothetical protein
MGESEGPTKDDAGCHASGQIGRGASPNREWSYPSRPHLIELDGLLRKTRERWVHHLSDRDYYTDVLICLRELEVRRERIGEA